MKLFFFFIFFIFYNLSKAKIIQCNFEEVYQDGSLQFGKVLFHEGLLRYQYSDQQLFTIILNKDYFVIRNDKPEMVSKLEKNDLLNELTYVLSNYPEVEKNYISNEMRITIESSHKVDFPKRISLSSPDANLSIYFIDCQNKKLTRNYFQPFSLNNISQ